jgi:DNA polymerase III epsilon subunit-like protein
MTAPALVFLDTETTGLDPDGHEIWEVALILRHDLDQPREKDEEILLRWMLDLSTADPTALRLNGFYDRITDFDDGAVPTNDCDASEIIATQTAGAHLVGAVPDFDSTRLDAMLRTHGWAPAWHYHLIDVEALAIGFLYGRFPDGRLDNFDLLPWRSETISQLLDVQPPKGAARHSAMGDARWARDLYDAVTRGGIQ